MEGNRKLLLLKEKLRQKQWEVKDIEAQVSITHSYQNYAEVTLYKEHLYLAPKEFGKICGVNRSYVMNTSYSLSGFCKRYKISMANYISVASCRKEYEVSMYKEVLFKLHRESEDITRVVLEKLLTVLSSLKATREVDKVLFKGHNKYYK